MWNNFMSIVTELVLKVSKTETLNSAIYSRLVICGGTASMN
jgi:hypothetical protein